jgi:hypothetical protein
LLLHGSGPIAFIERWVLSALDLVPPGFAYPYPGGRSQYFSLGTEVFHPRAHCHARRPSTNIALRDRPPGLIKLLVDMMAAKALDFAIRSTPPVGNAVASR